VRKCESERVSEKVRKRESERVPRVFTSWSTGKDSSHMRVATVGRPYSPILFVTAVTFYSK